MSVKFDLDGTVHCYSVRYNHRQCRNLIAYGGGVAGPWTSTYQYAFKTPDHSEFAKHTVFTTFSTSDGVNMCSQSMPPPIANHKYYGAVHFKSPAGYSAADARFEWYHTDGDTNNNLTFAQKNFSTNNQWVILSNIVQAGSNPNQGSWQIRNFAVSPTITGASTSRAMIIDLTDTFGAGNEPSKEWCDNNILEHSTFQSGIILDVILNATNYTESSWHTAAWFNYLTLNSNWEPREAMFGTEPSDERNEGYLTTKVGHYLTNQYVCYGSILYRSDAYHNDTSYDCYWPVAEPLLGQTKAVRGQDSIAGGGMREWKRATMYGNRSSFSTGTYPMRFDYNNMRHATQIRIADLNMADVNSLVRAYNAWFSSQITLSDINKRWCDRWVQGYNWSTIRIKDPAKRYIKFNTGTQEATRTAIASYTKAQLDSYVGLQNDGWSGITNYTDLHLGERAYIQVLRSDDNKLCRFVIEVVAANSTTITTNNLGYGPEGSTWWNATLERDDIVCNDIEIHPEIEKIVMDNTGTLRCKKLVTDTVY